MQPKWSTTKRKWPYFFGALVLAGILAAGLATIFSQLLGGPPWPIGFWAAFSTLAIREIIDWIIAWRRARRT